jgi:hypothetical protein
MSNTNEQINKLSRQLFPNGRAFKYPFEGVIDKLNMALSESETRAYNDAFSILNSIIADNPNFDETDASQWERRLGLIDGSASPLSTRIQAINQKLNYPNTDAPRQHWSFIQQQLQDAGFNVYVYENNFGGVTKTPAQVLGITSGTSLHATNIYHGTPTPQHGSGYNNKIVNYIDESLDATFVIGSNYRSTFYISSSVIDVFADVPAARKNEFRQLILQLKPAQMCGFLFVNYI